MAPKRQRFAQRRKAMGYTQESFAERLDVDRNTVVRWEAGANEPQPWMRPRIARALQISVDELDRLLTSKTQLAYPVEPLLAFVGDRQADEASGVPLPSLRTEASGDELEALELAGRIEASDVGSATIAGLELGINNLCRAYTAQLPRELLGPVRRYRRAVSHLLDAKATLRQRRELMVVGGWTSLLGACLHVDLGQRSAADASRRTAHEIGIHTGHNELTAWALEIGAWQALLDHRYEEAVELCRAGQQLVDPVTGVYVQLTAQEARAWARLKRSSETLAALNRSAAAFAQTPLPSQPDHHFAFDPRKQIGYTATTLAWLGAADRAEAYARETVRFYGEGGRTTSPRRLATARIDLAMIVAQQDLPEEACRLGNQALASGRLLPSNVWRAAELSAELQSRFGKIPVVRDFKEHYLDVHEAIARGSPPAVPSEWAQRLRDGAHGGLVIGSTSIDGPRGQR